MFISPVPKFICWNLILNVLVFGDGAFKRCLSGEGEALMNGINALIKGTSERSLASLAV